MANTRSSAKRARQSKKRQDRNQIVQTATKTALRNAIRAISAKKTDEAKTAYLEAVKVVSKAASKGAIPKTRAARKISRLTKLAQRVLPQTLA